MTAQLEKLQSEPVLASILDRLPDAIVCCDGGGEITFCNRAGLELFGQAKHQILGRPLQEFVPAAKILLHQHSDDFISEIEFKRFNGNVTQMRAAVRYDPADPHLSFCITLGNAKDHLEQQRARLAIDASRVGIWDWDLQQQSLVWNEHFRHMFGMTSTAGPFELFETCLHPRDRASVVDMMTQSAASGKDYFDTYRVVWPDGSVHWIEAHGQSIADEHRKAIRMTGTTMDVTERKRIQDDMQFAERRLQTAVEAGQIGFWDWDLKTNKVTRSLRHAEMLGISQMVGEQGPPEINYYAEDLEAVKLQTQQAIAAKTDHHTEYRVVTPDGRIRWIESRGRALRDDNDKPIRLVGISQDITERKDAEAKARLRDAEVAHLSRVSTMGNLAAGLAHELNQPLGAILNYASVCQLLVKSSGQANDQLTRAIEEVMNETRRASAIISRLRGFVTKQGPRVVKVGVKAMIQKSIALLDFELRQQKVSVRTQDQAGNAKVLADSVQIEQVVVNLLYNAMQAMENSPESKRHVLFTVSWFNEQFVQVSVTDTGPGMSGDILSRLFEPFFSTKPNGMGIGLNISRSIIESHGGRLTAINNPGSGMTFSFTLPVVPDEQS